MFKLTNYQVMTIVAAGAAIAGIVVISAALAAGSHGNSHGHGDSHGDNSGHHGGMMKIGEPGDKNAVDRTINITMFDNYYEPENLNIEAGETIRFVINNAGEAVHEFGLGTASMHKMHQKQMEKMVESGALDYDKIHHEKMGHGHGGMAHDDPNSVLLEPGQSGEIVWKFADVKNLEFACNIPGHYESGMMGPIMLGHGH